MDHAHNSSSLPTTWSQVFLRVDATATLQSSIPQKLFRRSLGRRSDNHHIGLHFVCTTWNVMKSLTDGVLGVVVKRVWQPSNREYKQAIAHVPEARKTPVRGQPHGRGIPDLSKRLQPMNRGLESCSRVVSGTMNRNHSVRNISGARYLTRTCKIYARFPIPSFLLSVLSLADAYCYNDSMTPYET